MSSVRAPLPRQRSDKRHWTVGVWALLVVLGGTAPLVLGLVGRVMVALVAAWRACADAARVSTALGAATVHFCWSAGTVAAPTTWITARQRQPEIVNAPCLRAVVVVVVVARWGRQGRRVPWCSQVDAAVDVGSVAVCAVAAVVLGVVTASARDVGAVVVRGAALRSRR